MTAIALVFSIFVVVWVIPKRKKKVERVEQRCGVVGTWEVLYV